ncbi:hypothetical protein F5Y10DRAFT_293241 [Nemania abortiva]|nr:hypothetical protein F5Y10DRAFT_293241 [Nemania abortiva]
MATYERLKQDPRTRDLFNNKITTIEGLQSALEDHAAFLALDTEHGPVDSQRDRVLYQVGLAYLPAMTPHAPVPRQLRLGDFYHENHLRCLTLSINLSEKTREDLVRCQGGVPKRRPSRFGCERHVDLGSLEPAIVEFIQSCNPSTKKLVLVGFEMAAEWTYLSGNFPSITSHFSSWMDLRDIAKDIATIGDIPGRVSVLQTFGYSWKNIKGPNKLGSADNAGDDAEKLRFRQKCSQIACKCSRRKGPLYFNGNEIAFGARIQSRDGLLPDAVNSGMKLARYFFDFVPISTGLESAKAAFIMFESRDQLDRFIEANDGRLLPTGETLSVTAFEEDAAEAKRTAEREEKRRLRKIKKVERLESEFVCFGDAFSEPNA